MTKRLFFFMILCVLWASSNAYDLIIEGPKSSNISDDPWEHVACDFKSNTIYPIEFQYLNEHQMKVVLWDNDFSNSRDIVITFPPEYNLPTRYIDEYMVCLGHFSGDVNVMLSMNLFSNSGLLEGVIKLDNVYLFFDENSKVLGVYPRGSNNLGCLINPELVGGKLIFENGVTVYNTNDSGIQSILHEKPSSVSPNPSNGATNVEINWDFIILDDAQLNVIDIDGKLVHTQTIKAGNRKTNLSTSHFASGTYIYVVQGNNGYTLTGKFVIN